MNLKKIFYFVLLLIFFIAIIGFSIVLALLYSYSTVYPFVTHFLVATAIIIYTLLDYVVFHSIIRIKMENGKIELSRRITLTYLLISFLIIGIFFIFFSNFLFSFELIAVADYLGNIIFNLLFSLVLGGITLMVFSAFIVSCRFFKQGKTTLIEKSFRKIQLFGIITLISVSGTLGILTIFITPDGNWNPMGFSEPAYNLPLGPHFNTNLDKLSEEDKIMLTSIEKALWAISKLRQQGGFPMWAETDGSHFYSDREQSMPLFPGEFSLQEGTALLATLYLEMYRLEPNPIYLRIAIDAADALIAVQDEENGGFYYDARRYEDGTGYQPHPKNHMRTAILDDNVMQSCLSFLLDIYVETGDSDYKSAFERGFECLCSMERPQGGWIQRSGYLGKIDDLYFNYATLNDGTLHDVVMVLLKAYRIFPTEVKYLNAAKRGCQFLVNVQGNGGSEQQTGWAQQYDDNNLPAWARNFEPPAICSLATVSAMETLLQMYLATGNFSWLNPIPSAIQWLESDDTIIEWEENGIIQQGYARLYELETNIPIYGWDYGKGLLPIYYYEPVRQGYGWRGDFGVNNLISRFNTLKSINYQINSFKNQELQMYYFNLKINANFYMTQQTEDGFWLNEGKIRAGSCATACQFIIDYLDYVN